MKIDFRAIPILIFLLLTGQSLLAATASGSSALALASVVVVHSPVLSTGDKLLIRRLFNGHYYQLRGDTKVISVEANAIVCSIGNVDITSHSCKLTFGGKTINLTGTPHISSMRQCRKRECRQRVRQAKFTKACRTWFAPSTL